MSTGAVGAAAVTSPRSKPGGRQKRPRVAEEHRKRAMRACDSCRRHKEKCEGGVPCQRCNRLRRTCQFVMSSGSDGEPSTLDRTPCEPGSESKVVFMERIIKHFLGEVPFEIPALQRIADSLQNENNPLPSPITNEHDDDTEDLEMTDEDFTVKALSGNAAHYSGEFSHWSFSRRVQQRVDRLSASTDQVEPETYNAKEYYRAKDLHPSGPTLISVADWFPPQPISEFLIASFFKYAQTNYYYVEESWTMTKLASLYNQMLSISSDDAPSLCILLMLLAIGTQCADLDSPDATAPCDDSSCNPDRSVEIAVDITFYRHAVQLIPDVIAIASIESVQACLLLGVYTLPWDTAGLSCTYLGLAIKMAIQNGMHRKYAGIRLDTYNVEIRNRLWWTVYTLDKRICILHGRPVSISNSDTDAELPHDLPDHVPSAQPRNFTNMQAMIKLTTQLESISLTIKMLRSSPKELRARRLDELMQHSQSLKKWWLSLPTDIYCRDLDPQHIMFRPNVHLTLSFLLTQIFMGRPFLFTCDKASSDQSPKSSLTSSLSTLISDCVQAASKILDICQLLRDNVGLARASYTEFSSCRAAMLAILAHSLNDGSERWRNALNNGMKLMRLMSRGLESAKSELSVIETLERAVSRLDARLRSERVEKDRSQRSGYEKYKSWAQLWKHSPQVSDWQIETGQLVTTPGDAYEIAGFAGTLIDTDMSQFMFDDLAYSQPTTTAFGFYQDSESFSF